MTEHDEKNSKFQIKQTLAISASGHKSQSIYTIAGLSKSELPKEKMSGWLHSYGYPWIESIGSNGSIL
jgi:hypothetical protein